MESGVEKEFFERRYQHALADIRLTKSVLVHFNGLLTQDQIALLENAVESSVSSCEIPKSPVKKIFFISVETLQNMLIHGHKDKTGLQHNYFILSKNGTKVEITSANLISNQLIPSLSEKIFKINSFDEEKELKQYYMEHLSNNEISEKGGAGLGFITIAMKSGNKLQTVFEKISDDYSLFELTSTVSIV